MFDIVFDLWVFVLFVFIATWKPVIHILLNRNETNMGTCRIFQEKNNWQPSTFRLH